MAEWQNSLDEGLKDRLQYRLWQQNNIILNAKKYEVEMQYLDKAVL
jgi:hypothetical protein